MNSVACKVIQTSFVKFPHKTENIPFGGILLFAGDLTKTVPYMLKGWSILQLNIVVQMLVFSQQTSPEATKTDIKKETNKSILHFFHPGGWCWLD